ncbi:MAG: AmmeMemoRadiSam system protein A [Bacillota bacterium]
MLKMGCLTPHPPILLPEVGGAESKKVDKTYKSMQKLAEDVGRLQPETVVFFTPHGNVFQDAFTFLPGERIEGSLRRFGFDRKFAFANDLPLLKRLQDITRRSDLSLLPAGDELVRRFHVQQDLDHGILVPLYFLCQNLPQSCKLAAISIAFTDNGELYEFGKAVREAAEVTGRDIVIVASGDLSHRLTESAPAGYHPKGRECDEALTVMVGRGDFTGILNMDRDLLEDAGECGYRPLVMLLGALEGLEVESELLSYEGPFGVGYAVAEFRPGRAAARSVWEDWRRINEKALREKRSREHPLVRWARRVAEEYVSTGKIPSTPGDLPAPAGEKAGVFVSVKKHGRLRGCIGTIEPAASSVAEEIKMNAVAAVSRDPRFEPVDKGELEALTYSVDVLSPSEPVKEPGELDPSRYGVIVENGGRRGLLLPDLPGVDTVEQQLSIARNKAGIGDDESVDIRRFKVTRYR